MDKMLCKIPTREKGQSWLEPYPALLDVLSGSVKPHAQEMQSVQAVTAVRCKCAPAGTSHASDTFSISELHCVLLSFNSAVWDK